MSRVRKKYHIIPYIVIILTIIIAAFGIKWFRYSNLSIGSGSEAIYLYRYYRFIVVVLLAGASVLFYNAFVKKRSVCTLFVIAGAFLGIMFSLAVTPNAAADETKHMYAATSFANKITNVADSDEPYTYYTRVTDALNGLDKNISASNYSVMAQKMVEKPSKEDKYLIKASSEVYNYSPVAAFFYSPAIIGIVIGRALGLNGILTYTIARLLMLTVYLVLGALAIRKIPMGKNILALVMLMPTAISRAACVSEDAIIHGTAFLFVAYAVSFIMSRKKIKTCDAVIMAVCGVIIAMSKGGVYLPLLLLLFMIPKENFGTKIKYPSIVAVSIAVAIGAFIVANPTLIKDFAGSDSQLIYTDSETGYSLGRIISNPKESLQTLLATIFVKSGDHYSEMLAGGFGWLQIYVSDLTVVMCTILLAISVLNLDGKEICFSKKQRILTYVAIFVGGLLIIASMWIFWSPDTTGYIQGIQGRYFLPYLFPALLALKNHKAVIRKNIDNFLIFGIFLIGIVTFFEIWVRISI